MWRCIVMHHVTIWHRLINADALPQDRYKSVRRPDCLVSGTTTNGAVTLVSVVVRTMEPRYKLPHWWVWVPLCCTVFVLRSPHCTEAPDWMSSDRLKFSVATMDFRHSNFTEMTYEINVDRRRTTIGWSLLTDCHSRKPMVLFTCMHLTNNSVVTHTGRDLNTERH